MKHGFGKVLGLAVVSAGALLSSCGGSDGAGSNPGGGGTAPPADLVQKAETALPPGQSGFFPSSAQAQFQGSGDPAVFGPHVDDQRLLYWSFDFKPGTLGEKPGEPQIPIEGVEIYYDAYGVPIVYADTIFNVWYGVAYAAAQQRMFLMDAVRRLGRGTMAAFAGCGFYPADLQQRVLTYSDEEYNGFFEALPQSAQESIDGYVAGANAYIAEINADPSLLPGEYQLLTTTPESFDRIDVMAGGVLITRSVAAEGGNEFQNIRMLRLLEDELGAEPGRRAFLDLVWDEDRKAVTTVPPDAQFSNQALPAGGRDAAFNARADWALSLPETLVDGDGTGAAAPPALCSGLPLPVPAKAAVNNPVAEAVRNLHEWGTNLHGGSFAVAIAGNKTRDGGPMLISAPQLGYTYPTQLWELEVHGPGIDARGSTVPGLPAVGIGYTDEVAWALTTGYSKTIDSFIETICSTDQISAGDCSANQYFHEGLWKDMDCRTEAVAYRVTQQGAPAGPAVDGDDVEICRTVHGPIVARDDAAGLARSLQYAMFGREIDNITGIQAWAQAETAQEFLAATATLTWNENVTFVTREGDIGYVHPGLYPVRHPEADQRMPIPGEGAFDHDGFLSPTQMPRSINPERGYLANWNNKPALGWLEGEGISPTSRPGGPGQRVTILLDTIAARDDWSFAAMREIDLRAGVIDPRAREYLGLMLSLSSDAGVTLNDSERAAIGILSGWDQRHYSPDIDIEDPASTDGPAPTIFSAWVDALRAELFGFTQALVIRPSGDPEVPDYTVFSRSSGVGNHVFDHSVMDNLIVRILDPDSSSLALRYDWAAGRAAPQVLKETLTAALSQLAADYGTGDPPTIEEMAEFRRTHPVSQIDSLTGVVGPSGIQMPYQDRGSWNHIVGYEQAD